VTPDQQIAELNAWLGSDRFRGITRVYTSREVFEQRGTIPSDYTVARDAAEKFYEKLRALFSAGKSITTFGPYSPGQAVAMKRAGIDGIYLGGWATSAKGSVQEDPGPDFASYPLSQVPDEAAPIVRALLTADRNQHFARSQMTSAQRAATPEIDYRPYIIADADTGHGGDGHVRNLVRRFVEVGVPGYHIEDQKPGAKKCGHQAGKVLVPEDEQIKRLSAARFQLDIMGVPGIIVARTDAESATLLDGRSDERDQPFILGATNLEVPAFRAASLAVLRHFAIAEIGAPSGHRLYALTDEEYAHADAWLVKSGLAAKIVAAIEKCRADSVNVDGAIDKAIDDLVDIWQKEAGVATFAEAVAAKIETSAAEGRTVAMSKHAWVEFATHAPFYLTRARARELDVTVTWECEHAKTVDGYYQVRGGLEYAIAKSLAAAPFADILWMETKTANLAYAKQYADAIHAQFPDKMLAYNLSPSFNWDTTGMTDEEMRAFPEELGKHGFVFNFITYGGHQIDGLAGEEFAAALKQIGMLALAKLQRQLRLLESPYRTPQALVGGPRSDAGLMSISGRTASTKAMGQGSTHVQHLVQTEVPPKTLTDWLDRWRAKHGLADALTASLKPLTAGSDLLELSIRSNDGAQKANVVFASIQDRRGRNILTVRDMNNFDVALRNKRLVTLAQLFLLLRYKSEAVHYMAPTDDNRRQAERMQARGIFRSINLEIGEIIVAEVDRERVTDLTGGNTSALDALIG
jgi:isocitrate lyase